jgi:hypothetical protein
MGYASHGATLTSPKAIGSGLAFPESTRSVPTGLHLPASSAIPAGQSLYGPTTRSYSPSPAPAMLSQYSVHTSAGNSVYVQPRLQDYGSRMHQPAQLRPLAAQPSPVLPQQGFASHGSQSQIQDLIFNSIEEYLEKRASFGTSSQDLQRIAGLLIPQDVHALYGQQEQVCRNIQQKVEAEKRAVGQTQTARE